ncbi:hypothetical protein PseAD21_27880 [Pseudomonas sp. AD21]|nr:hypothetical protein PseAD21_27880 [Pseudomonas sp. AD21]
MGQTIGAFVEFAITQAALTGLHGDSIRSASHLCFEQPVQRLLQRAIDLRRVEVHQQTLTLIRRQQRHLRQHHLIIVDQRCQQLLEVTDEAANGRFVEQRRGVVQRPANPARVFTEGQRQVEFDEAARPGHAFEGQIAQGQRRTVVVVPTEQRLEQRAMGQAAQRLADFHHLFERQVLMRLRLQGLRLDPRQQRLAAWLVRGVDAQGQGVDEHADQAFDLGASTVGHRRADHHLGLTGQTTEGHRPGAHDHHVRRHRPALTQGLDPATHCLAQLNFNAGTAVVLLRRTRAVGGQGQQRRRAGQGLLPVIALALQHLAAEPAALPHRVVGVLQRQWRQRVGLAVTERLIQRRQFTGQHAHRPTVGDDVVQGQQQHMVIVRQPHQTPAQQRIFLQIERHTGLGLGQAAQGLVGLRIATQVFDPQQQTAVHRQDQHLSLVVELVEPAAQGFVPRNDARQRPLQRVFIEPAAQAQADRDVVGAITAAHLRQEPQALLGERQRQHLITRRRQDVRQRAASGTAEHVRHGGEFRVGEQLAQRQFDPQLLAHLRQHAHRQQRMPAQFKEVVVTTDLRNLQHVGPDPSQTGFQRIGRWLISAAEQRLLSRRGQRLAVDLAVVVQRQHRKLHPRTRHHVFRQPRQQLRVQVGAVQRLLVRGVISHQTQGFLTVAARQHHGFLDPGAVEQATLDFSQFDTETTDLHLVVIAPDAIELPRCQPARQVTGAIQQRTWPLAERITQELLGGQVRAVQITQRHALPADVQLAGHAHRHRLLMRVEHIHLGVGDRSANRHALGVFRHFEHLEGGGVGGGFGRAVAMHDAQLRRLGPQCAERRRIAALATAQQDAQALERLRNQLHVLIEQRGGDEQHRRPRGAQLTAERIRIKQGRVIDHHHAPTVEQRPPDVHGAGVERRIGGEHHAVLRVEIGVTVVQHQPADGPVRDHHTLRRAGGAGGVHDVRQRFRGLQQVRVVRRLAAELQAIKVDARRRVIDHFATEGQQRHCLTVLDHERLALARRVDVQRHIGRRALGNRQLRHQQFQRARQQDRHGVARLHALADQMVRQAIGLGVQFKVAQRMLAVHRRHSLWMGCGLLLEYPVHGQRLRVLARGGVEPAQQALTLILGE